MNTGLIVFFFSFFGSRFVLAPGLGVNFELPHVAGAQAGAARTTHQITVDRSGFIFIGDGPSDLKRLREWLKEGAKETRHPVLLVKADAQVPSGDLTKIWSVAHEAGFEVQLAAEELTEPGGGH